MNIETEQESRQTITICNQRGLHARAAGKFVRVASSFESEIWVMKADMVVSASSIMGLMMLGAGIGSQIELWSRGPDALEAMQALTDLINNKFEEEQ